MHAHLRRVAALVAVLVTVSCHPVFKRTYPEPSADKLLEHVRAVTDRVESLRAETRSDVWVSGDRANVELLVVAARPDRLRFMVMSPTGDSATDLSSDGTTYCIVDKKKNCGHCGPATSERVGRLLQLAVPPADIVATMFGGTPIIAPAEATVSWDAEEGREVIRLESAEHRQVLELDGRDGTWDVLSSELRDSAGKLIFRIRHKEFHASDNEPSVRVPGATLIETAEDDAKIDWKVQTTGEELAPARFRMNLQPGLRACD